MNADRRRPLIATLLAVVLALVFARPAHAAGCEPRFVGDRWAFQGAVVEQAAYNWRFLDLPVVRVACGAASVWVAVQGETPPVGVVVRVRSHPEDCDLAWCNLARWYADTTVWSEADFIREGRGPWFPWRMLFWNVEVLHVGSHCAVSCSSRTPT